ncbi:MAG: ABC transporter permease [Coriobacteriia bacterium]|nr:ABC transporter permease [Coriobacteriia bacterium]
MPAAQGRALPRLEFEAGAFERLEKRDRTQLPPKAIGFARTFLRELVANKLALVSTILLLVVIIATLLAPLSPYDPYALDVKSKLLGPSAAHWFGTDEYGRDYFTRVLYGGRISLLVGFCAMLLTVALGSLIGIAAGYVGGKLDTLLMRFTDVFLALPSMLLMVILNAFLRPSIPTLIAVLSLFGWASVARITRAETLSLKERDFMVATRQLGAGHLRMAVLHILPNILGPVSVAASLSVASAILSESSLSFLGLGVSIPYASWGSMLQGAQAQILSHPMLAVYPGLMILITVLAFNLLGDVLRSALAPKVAR